MIVELIGGIVLLAGLIFLFAGALMMPASGPGPGDGYLIGGRDRGDDGGDPGGGRPHLARRGRGHPVLSAGEATR